MDDVPANDLRAQYRTIKTEIDAAIQSVVDTQRFIRGPKVEEFEKAFSAATGAAHVVGLSSGTAALSLALEVLGIGHGDEVIVPSMTFAATAEAVCHVGATPVFADADPATLTLSPSSLDVYLTDRTRAVIPVHLYGNLCDMGPIMTWARNHDLFVIEDAAQAHLATYRGEPVGSFGDIATYSFFPGKNLGAYGDAGAITTKHGTISEHIRMLRDHGRAGKYSHSKIGYNHRMDSIQAAVLSVKLRHLRRWTDRRRDIAQQYDNALQPLPLTTMTVLPNSEAVYHLYPILIDHRDLVIEYLQSVGIGAGIHYPVPLHRQSAFAQFVPKGSDLSVSDQIGGSEISLPLFPEMTDRQVSTVVRAVESAATLLV